MEKVFLAGLHLKGSAHKLRDANASLDELARLVDTAGGTVAGRTLQQADSPNPSTFIGKGKVEELRKMALAKQFSTLVFDDELKPAQQRNLAEIIPVKVLDRTRVILDIFAKRAHTREGILQVELAQLAYLLPRITERYGTFEQQVGGIGTRGPGERKLEMEARHIRDRMALLRRQTETVRQHREIARERRHRVPLPIITIVGYTNAGKSTLLNKLVSLSGESAHEVYADNKLFATLDPTTRRIRLPGGRWALFTDTVGFIDKLPHNLITAFRATLEETLDADLLIHLSDASDPRRAQHSETVSKTLRSLQKDGADTLSKIVTVYNKIDLLTEHEHEFLTESSSQSGEPAVQPILISASRGEGLKELLRRIEVLLLGQMVETDLYIPFRKSAVLESLYRLGQVETISHRKQGVQLHVRLQQSHLGRIQKILSDRARA